MPINNIAGGRLGAGQGALMGGGLGALAGGGLGALTSAFSDGEDKNYLRNILLGALLGGGVGAGAGGLYGHLSAPQADGGPATSDYHANLARARGEGADNTEEAAGQETDTQNAQLAAWLRSTLVADRKGGDKGPLSDRELTQAGPRLRSKLTGDKGVDAPGAALPERQQAAYDAVMSQLQRSR